MYIYIFIINGSYLELDFFSTHISKPPQPVFGKVELGLVLYLTAVARKVDKLSC